MKILIWKYKTAAIGGIKMYKKIAILIITIVIIPLLSVANDNNEKEYNIFQQYKQETVFPQYNSYNNSYMDYNMFFGSSRAFDYGRFNNHERHNYRYPSYYGNFPPMFYPPFYMMNNNSVDNSAEFYLKNMPKNTLVSPDEYNIFNRSLEK